MDEQRQAELFGEPIFFSGRMRQWQGIVYLAYRGLEAARGKPPALMLSEEQADRAAWVCGPLLKQMVDEIERVGNSQPEEE